MSTIPLSLDDDLVELLRASPQPMETTARELIILELYRQGVLSGGRAAEMTGCSRWEYIQKAAQAGVPYFHMSAEDWQVEARESESL